jgi:hypothetical protein
METVKRAKASSNSKNLTHVFSDAMVEFNEDFYVDAQQHYCDLLVAMVHGAQQ